MGFFERLQHGWNAFKENDKPANRFKPLDGYSYSVRPDRVRLSTTNERSIVTAIYNRIAIDVASINIVHSRLDENDRFIEEIKSGLNECLTTEANIDQSGRAFIRDLVLSLFDEGCVAVVPVDTTISPLNSGGYDIKSMRVGKIVQWYPEKVKVLLYNDAKGIKEEVVMPKRSVAIIENPLYSVMNEPNSTLKRLTNKLSLLDKVDEYAGSGKLDIIIQLPYVIKSEARKEQAEKRRQEIEMQLKNSTYGIAYTDGTERITQLNRSLENNLLKQVEYLTEQLYNHLGLTQDVIKGTANEETMLNYYSRTVEPILSAITSEMTRKFITKTARTQGQRVMFFRDPFKLVPISTLSDIADRFIRNEILTANEIRAIVGFKAIDQPKADELYNPNLRQQSQEGEEIQNGGEVPEEGADGLEEEVEDPEAEEAADQEALAGLDEVDGELDELERLLNG